ncbi:MAG: hypothetical protein ACLPY1_09790 [Terracidiphilus sp.]
MGTATLVNYDIENGQQVIDALDQAGKAPNVALWAKLPDYENWRLVLASDRLDQSSPFVGYSEINEAIDKAGIPMHRQPTILLRPMDNPFIQELRGLFSAAGDTRGMRLGGQRFGDKYLEDAFVYRIR